MSGYLLGPPVVALRVRAMPKSGKTSYERVYESLLINHKDLANNVRFHIVAAYFLQVVKKSNGKWNCTKQVTFYSTTQ